MSYRVLALKWRPKGFREVVAQEHVTQTLMNSLSSNRIANAYLFSGPRGVGKTTTARILAKALNCQNGPAPEPCDSCSICKEITEGRNLDVFEIDGASNRGIDEIRNLRENVRYTPSSARMKIYIVDEVHMLTTEAFNALLKTLEEPPEHVRFIFATTEPHKVPATILSRCQRFDFKRIPTNQIIEQLKIICKEEKIQIGEDSLLVIAKKADGSLRDGESLLDQLISFCGTEIGIEDVLEAFSVVSQDLLFDVSAIIAESKPQEGIFFIEKLIGSGHDITEFLHALIEHFRNILLSKVVEDAQLLEVSESEKERYLTEADRFSQEDLLRMIEITSETLQQMKFAPNPRIKLETCLLKLIRLDQSVTLQNVIDRLSSEKPEDQSKAGEPRENVAPRSTVQQDQKKNPQIVSETAQEETDSDDDSNGYSDDKREEVDSVSIETFVESWSALIQFVQTRRLYVSVFLKEGLPHKFVNNVLQIGFPDENGFQIEAMKRNRDVILHAIQEILGITVGIDFVRTGTNKKARETVNDKDSPAMPVRRKIDPKVKRIMDAFDGELLTVGGEDV